jgi:hypothetical protein
MPVSNGSHVRKAVEVNKQPDSLIVIVIMIIIIIVIIMSYSSTSRLPGARRAARPGVFLMKSKRNHVVAVAGKEALSLVGNVHDDAYSSNVVHNLAVQSPEQVVVGVFVAEIELAVVAIHPAAASHAWSAGSKRASNSAPFKLQRLRRFPRNISGEDGVEGEVAVPGATAVVLRSGYFSK